MKIKIGPYEFESVTYFPGTDHLRAGGGQVGDSEDSRHVFFYDGDELRGVEFFGPRQQLESEGAITVVLPSGERVRVPDAERIVRDSLTATA